MGKHIHILSDNIISPLGFSTEENYNNVLKGNSGVKRHENKAIYPTPVWVSKIDAIKIDNEFDLLSEEKNKYTSLEKILITSISKALQQTDVSLRDKKTLLLIASTKGNVDLINNPNSFGTDRIHLGESANVIGRFFECANKPKVICNACISGVLAIDVAKRLLRGGRYQNIVITGGDMISEFIVSGFQSFKAMSDDHCKPFDANRKGINLGEGAGTMVLSIDERYDSDIILEGSASSNDANHISGPSRTGDGLFIAMNKAMNEAKCSPETIDYLCMHGTATNYNDEMESKAINLAKLEKVPLNSFKGYLGHTLGAAGLIESILAIASMRKNTLLKSYGYEECGVSMPVEVISKNKESMLYRCLKSSSGFGGCNAVAIFSKKSLQNE